MMISVDGLQELRDQLDKLDISTAQRYALESTAQALEAGTKQAIIRDSIDDHSKRLPQNDEQLYGSITHTVGSDRAVVGSDSATAIGEELGTNRNPPRSLMLTVAQECAEDLVQIAASTIAESLGGRNG